MQKFLIIVCIGIGATCPAIHEGMVQKELKRIIIVDDSAPQLSLLEVKPDEGALAEKIDLMLLEFEEQADRNTTYLQNLEDIFIPEFDIDPG